jgi:uncharacterized integral membrane protein (TIGR00697 family)
MKNVSAFAISKQPTATKRVVLLGMLFVTFLIAANFTAFKVAELHITKTFVLDFPAALIFFPLTYFFDDVLTEVYGFKISRLIIWGGMICSALVTLCTWIAVYLPASPIWDAHTHHGASAYALVFQSSTRVFIASMFAYFCGEFLNSMILAKLKVQTAGKHFFLRIISSTGIGAAVDSMIFCNVAFWGIMPQQIIWKMILTIYLFKLCYEIIALPITYSLVAYLKQADCIDHFDTHTKFNPFSLSLAD